MRRERTNTPLQALLLLNEPQIVEASRALAERTLREAGPTTDERLSYMFRLATVAPARRQRPGRAERRIAGLYGSLHQGRLTRRRS